MSWSVHGSRVTVARPGTSGDRSDFTLYAVLLALLAGAAGYVYFRVSGTWHNPILASLAGSAIPALLRLLTSDRNSKSFRVRSPQLRETIDELDDNRMLLTYEQGDAVHRALWSYASNKNRAKCADRLVSLRSEALGGSVRAVRGEQAHGDHSGANAS